MGLFPRFSGLINQNIQQPPKEESKNSENDKSSNQPKMKKYYDEDEIESQTQLWADAEKKRPWYDPPPKVKVTTKNGIYHMKIELTVGLPPDGVFELFTNPENGPMFNMDNSSSRELLENKSRKVLMEDGPRQIFKSKKAVAWDFLWWTGSFPITLIFDENRKDLTAKYKKEKMMFMKVFEGNYKVEPLYVDSERLCKHRKPKNQEEYNKCSGGKRKIASKVIMDQYFQPYLPFNLPPFSWYIRESIINTTKIVLQMLQIVCVVLREVL